MDYNEQNNMSEEQNMNDEQIVTISPLNRLPKVFTSPTKVIKAIKQKPNILLPALVIGIIVLLFYILFMQQFKDSTMLMFEKMYPDATSEMLNTYAAITFNMMIIGTPIITVGGIFLSALYYWVFVLLFKGEGKYKHFVSLIAHVGLISLLQYIVIGIMIAITGEISTDAPVTSVASLLPLSMKNGLAYVALTKVEVFNIWRVIVIIIGLKEISKLNNYKVCIIAGVAFLVGVIYYTVSTYMSYGMYNL